MENKLKRDQIPPDQAKNWRQNLEKEDTFSIMVPSLILQKKTYLKLTGDNDNRIRIYLGLEPDKKDGKYVLCAYAVSTFLLGSGEVFRDYENPVIKLEKENRDVSSETEHVLQNINRYRQWRNGELDADNDNAAFRKYIYPKGYLMSKYELHEIFNNQNENEAFIAFGISSSMDVMVYPGNHNQKPPEDQSQVFNFSTPCPPACDESSIFNTENSS